jgi:hypothetical protein
MKLSIADFNTASDVFSEGGDLHEPWCLLESVLSGMPLYTKDSDQSGIKGKHVFDPVGVNGHIKVALEKASWGCNVLIPKHHTCFGKDVDFKFGGLLVEVQFANYPFLLNNVARSELFIREGWAKAVIVITKCNVLPGANSMLYFEQARNQLSILGMFNSPIRLVGLSVDGNDTIDGVWTRYTKGYYSRDVGEQRRVRYHTTLAKSKMKLHEIERGADVISPSATLDI